MTRVLLVRHGQTEWNRIERFRGQIDLPLNEIGHRQAAAIADALRDEPIKAIYAGLLQRAQDTARPIAARFSLPVQTLPGLLDINFGAWAGLTPEEVDQRDPQMHRLWRTQPHLAQPPGGESLAQVRERAVAALHAAIAAHPGETIVLVGHQVVNRVLLCAVIGLDNSHFWRIRQDNACLNIVEYVDGVFEIVLLNDTCHLRAAINRS